jgi:hypothetical protein
MANVRTLQRSFSGGEMSPEMFGRIDDAKVQNGLARCRNFVVKPQGAIENRPGTEYVTETKDSSAQSRLIPFTFSTVQTMVLEFGEEYIRFHTQGATLLAGSQPAYTPAATVTITIASPGVVTWNGHGMSNGDRVVFTTTGALPTGITAGSVYYVVNSATNTFQIASVSGGSAIITTGTQSGVHTGNRRYDEADLVSSGGTVYYAKRDNYAALSSADDWYPLPSEYYEIPTPYQSADLFDIHYVQSADILTIVHPNYPPKELRRYGATRWLLDDVEFTPETSSPTNQAVTAAGFTTAKYAYYYKVTAMDADNIVESPPLDVPALGIARTITAITKANPCAITCGTHAFKVGDLVYIKDIVGMTELNNKLFIVNKVVSTTVINIKTLDGTIVDSSSYTAWVSGGTVTGAFIRSNLLETGCTNTITWDDVPGASRYNVYKLQGGLYGYIGQTTENTLVDDNITPDMSKTPPIYDGAFESANNYPGAVSYYEQRKCFAGTNLEPQTIWMTKSGTESNMSYSLPTQDDDRIKFRVAAREANTIRHIVPLTQLLLLTSSAEWRVTSVNSDAITPSTISVRPQSYVGANNVQPVIINNTLVYCAARGGHVRELGYSWQSNGFITGDLSIRSAHLFDTYEIRDMAYSKAPQPIIWMVSTSGNLIGLTYIPEQQIGAWHWHDTEAGSFESCCVVAEGDEDRLYVIVKRTINGATKRYVERLASRLFSDQKDAFFVDCGLTYDGTNTSAVTMTVTGGTTWGPADALTITASSAKFAYPATTDVGDEIVLTSTDGNEYHLTITGTTSTTVAQVRVDKVIEAGLRGVATTSWAFARNSISGLNHLEGKTVSILADGGVHPPRTVTSGTITLDRPIALAHIGLEIEADAQTMPAAMQVDGSFGQGRYKNVNQAWLRVFRSSGIFVGPDADHLVAAKQRTTEPYGSPPRLKSEEIDVMLTPSWRDSGQVFIRQTDPLPLTIVSLTLEIALGG